MPKHGSIYLHSVSPYLFSSVCFKWHTCIVKRHTYLRGADKQPNTNREFFSGYQGRSIKVIFNTTRGTWERKAHYMRMTRDNCVFHCECLSLAISSLPMNLKWGTGRRSGYKNTKIQTQWHKRFRNANSIRVMTIQNMQIFRVSPFLMTKQQLKGVGHADIPPNTWNTP